MDASDASASTPAAHGWERLPENELQMRIDLTIGAALAAAATLGRG